MNRLRRIWLYLIGGIVAGLILGLSWGIFRPQTTSAPTVTTDGNRNVSTNTAVDIPLAGVTTFSTFDLPDRDPAFNFSADIPAAWAVEYVAASQAINLYDPRGQGGNSLENSKIFVKFFTANDFLTLTTVDILSQTNGKVAGRPAVTYRIKKKVDQADFSAQPSWRNIEHRVTDIRSTDERPAVFNVFAQSPEIDTATFDAVLASLRFFTKE